MDEATRVGAKPDRNQRRERVHVAVGRRYHVEAQVAGGLGRRTADGENWHAPRRLFGGRRRERPRAVRAREQNRLHAGKIEPRRLVESDRHHGLDQRIDAAPRQDLREGERVLARAGAQQAGGAHDSNQPGPQAARSAAPASWPMARASDITPVRSMR